MTRHGYVVAMGSRYVLVIATDMTFVVAMMNPHGDHHGGRRAPWGIPMGIDHLGAPWFAVVISIEDHGEPWRPLWWNTGIAMAYQGDRRSETTARVVKYVYTTGSSVVIAMVTTYRGDPRSQPWSFSGSPVVVHVRTTAMQNILDDRPLRLPRMILVGNGRSWHGSTIHSLSAANIVQCCTRYCTRFAISPQPEKYFKTKQSAF